MVAARPRFASAVALLLLSTLSAGCVDVPAPFAGRPVPEPLEFTCRDSTHQAGDVCASTTSLDGDMWAEPFVAAGPRGAFIILAQGRAATPPEPGLVAGALDPPEPKECHAQFGLCLFHTTDGLSWTRHEVVSPSGQFLAIDPSAAWAGDALLVAGLLPNGAGVGVMRSFDDGATFSEPRVFVQGERDDRPWLATHGDEVALVWQESGAARGFLTVSHDAGASWSDVVQLPCNVHSVPVWRAGWWIACAGIGGTEIHRFEDGHVQLQSTFPSGGGTRTLARFAEGFVTGAGSGGVRFSEDGIRWSDEIQLAGDVPVADRWIGWLGSSGDVALSVVWDVQGGCLFCDRAQVARTLVQVAPDGVLASHRITPVGSSFPSTHKPAFGEFDGLACAEECLVAWMDGGAIAHAWMATRDG